MKGEIRLSGSAFMSRHFYFLDWYFVLDGVLFHPKKMHLLLQNWSCRDTAESNCKYRSSTLRRALKPLVFKGSILRAWGNSNNSIYPALLDLHQYNDEFEWIDKNVNKPAFLSRGLRQLLDIN